MTSTVLVLGSFDLLHYGHIRFLNHASKLGEVVIGLGTDEYQEGYKRAPVCSYEERRRLLKELGYRVEPRSTVPIVGLVDQVSPDYLVVGSDWIGQPFLELSGIDVAYLERNGITLVFAPRDHEMSSTSILGRVNGS